MFNNVQEYIFSFAMNIQKGPKDAEFIKVREKFLLNKMHVFSLLKALLFEFPSHPGRFGVR